MDINNFKALPVEQQKVAYLDACESLDILNDMIQQSMRDRDWAHEQKLQSMADRLNTYIDQMDQIIGGVA